MENKTQSEAALPSHALFAFGKCPDCGHLQPSGTFKRQPHDKAKEPFRCVYSETPDGSMIFVDAKTIEMARATVCGFPNAKILILEANDQVKARDQ